MHILHYLNRIRLEEGGVVRAVLDMCTYQARAGHAVTLATCDDTHIPESWKRSDAGCPRVVNLGPYKPRPWATGELRSRFEPLIRDADVLHLHVIWDPVQLPLAAMARKYGRPYVQSPHGMLADWCMEQKKLKKRIFLTLAGRRLLRNAAFVHLAADGELEEAAKRHPETPGIVVPLVFDTEPFASIPDPALARACYNLPANDAPTVLFLGRLHYQKRPDLVATAVRTLHDRGIHLNLVLAGPGDPAYEAKLRAYVERIGLGDACTFTGMVGEHKASLYAAADLFVLTSTEESFGLVYFEAMACGTPVLTTRAAATWRELASTGGACLIDKIASDVPYGEVGGGDTGQLADAIGRMLDDRESLRSMGRAGRAWVLEHLAPESVVGRYIEMYQKAIDRSRR